MRKKIKLENVNHPGHVTAVDGEMYKAMRRAFLKVLAKRAPGVTEMEIRERVVTHLPDDLFPQGARAGWWAKAVQLDLESRGLVSRERTRPLRWHRA
jgi:hypothetical protein